MKSEDVVAGGDIIFATIHLKEDRFTYKITDGTQTFGQEKHQTLRKAKSEAKEHLKRLSVRFYDEVRPNKKT